MNTKLDILAFGAHPDDVELSCSGTLLKHIEMGYTAGIIDLTRGELGTRGTVKTREKEAKKASQLLGIEARHNLGLPDGFFELSELNLLEVIHMVRKYRPDIVLCNAPKDRHPDHGRAAELVSRACFLSGLRKIETRQAAWRPVAVYHYIQDYHLEPNLVVDISGYMERKIEVVKAFSSQFYDPESEEPETPIARKDFFEFLRARAKSFGRPIGAEYGEGFVTLRSPGVSNLFDLI